jgi:hypothetical protein
MLLQSPNNSQQAINFHHRGIGGSGSADRGGGSSLLVDHDQIPRTYTKNLQRHF